MDKLIPVGALRARLQPIIFVQLAEPVGELEVGDTVAMQYWGQGRVTLTRLFDEVTEVNVDHVIKVVEPRAREVQL